MAKKQSGADVKRCEWAGDDPVYVAYHDKEWGVPSYDDIHQFEHLVLEGMQAGLSWKTVLNKRDNVRKAFSGFDPVKVARFSQAKVEKLLLDPGIIRNRMKVEATVNNAKQFLKVQKEFGSFTKYIWGFVGNTPLVNKWRKTDQIPAKTTLAEQISKDLKAFGGLIVAGKHKVAERLISAATHTTAQLMELR